MADPHPNDTEGSSHRPPRFMPTSRRQGSAQRSRAGSSALTSRPKKLVDLRLHAVPGNCGVRLVKFLFLASSKGDTPWSSLGGRRAHRPSSLCGSLQGEGTTILDRSRSRSFTVAVARCCAGSIYLCSTYPTQQTYARSRRRCSSHPAT